MKHFTKPLLITLSLVGLLATISSTGCYLADEFSPIGSEDPPEAFSYTFEIIPEDKGNLVHIFPLERVTEQGNYVTQDITIIDVETGDTSEIPVSAHTYGLYSYNVSRLITKIRFFAVPGPGYKFDHWDLWEEVRYKDSWDWTNNSNFGPVKVHFAPIKEGESQGETPLDPGPNQSEHDLEVVLSPPEGGTVELSGNEGLVEPDSEPEVDEGDPSAWEVKQLYQWTLFGKTLQPWGKDFYEVNLTAIPSEGYRFVRWVGEGIEIENPEAASISLQVPTKALRNATGNVRIPRVYAYFALIPEEPQDEPLPPIQQTLYVSFDGRGQCTATQTKCSCNLMISVEGKDLTGGSYPVTNVTLTVNGDIWDDSGSISETHYSKTVERVVDCYKTFNIEVNATNSVGQTLSSTGSVSTAR